MPDSAELYIYDGAGDGVKVDRFQSYEVTSDLFHAASGWSFDCYDPGIRASGGMLVRLFINGTCALTGVIDKIVSSCSRSGRRLSISGRDLMGLVVDHCCDTYGSNKDGVSVRDMASELLATIPYLQRKDVVFAHGAEKCDTGFNFGAIDPGETVFGVLHKFAAARGLLFYATPAGQLIFDKPQASGPVDFYLRHLLPADAFNNVAESELVNDVSQVYSSVTITGQSAAGNAQTVPSEGGVPRTVNVYATEELPPGILPAHFSKPFIKSDCCLPETAKPLAHLYIQKMRSKSLALSYTVQGHSQNGSNWEINRLCRVDDDAHMVNNVPISGTYLIIRRTFTRDKSAGSRTKLELGLPGMAADE